LGPKLFENKAEIFRNQKTTSPQILSFLHLNNNENTIIFFGKVVSTFIQVSGHPTKLQLLLVTQKSHSSFADWTHFSSGSPSCFADNSKDSFPQNSLFVSFETLGGKRSKE
jgi:hypothetical protein